MTGIFYLSEAIERQIDLEIALNHGVKPDAISISPYTRDALVSECLMGGLFGYRLRESNDGQLSYDNVRLIVSAYWPPSAKQDLV